MKRIISILTSFCLLMSIFCFPVSADIAEEDIRPEYSLMNKYTNLISTSLMPYNSEISYNCNVVGNNYATKITVYLYLQVNNNGAWKDIDVVTKSVNGRTAYLNDTYPSPVFGKEYRTEAHVYVYSGSDCEYLELNSRSMIYNISGG